MLRKLARFLLDPHALRRMTQNLIMRRGWGSFEQRLRHGAIPGPAHGYILYQAALQARALGCPRIAAIEYGVAGGAALLNMERLAGEISRITGVEFELYGFDTGEGLPEPVDYRDLPYKWKKGFYTMDVPALRARLERAELVLGDLRRTAGDFFATRDPAPIGAISYDLDFYSSTALALAMLEAGEAHYLPRVFCFFDDIVGTEKEMYCEFTGALLAIDEFNRAHADIKMGTPAWLAAREAAEVWHRQIRVCHFFRHARYSDFVGEPDQQSPLR